MAETETETDKRLFQAKLPHEIMLTNLIGNHILWFVAALGMVKTFWQPLALVPLVSIGCISYVLWRTRRERLSGDPLVAGHWDLAARRCRVFVLTLALLGLVILVGLALQYWAGFRQVAVYAVIGGVGLLPTMVTVLVLIVMESDALHQAAQGKLRGRQF